jgi:hypothetical protein
MINPMVISQDWVLCGSAGGEDRQGSRSDCSASITPGQRVLEQAWQLPGAGPAGEAAHRRRFAEARHA